MKTIEELRDYALEKDVPIMKDDSIQFLTTFIREHDIKNILEIGSAIGYSAIRMAMVDESIHIVTIEKDDERAKEALENVQDFGLENQITCIHMDAREYDAKDTFDLLFIDAAKTANGTFFERFTPYVKQGGYVIVDNMYLYGFVDDISQVRTRRLRSLVKKVQKFKEMILSHPDYESEYYSFGDGVIIARKK